MAPTPLRIAQTSSEVKKKHKQNGLGLPARQQKQLERAHELDVRAARLRDAEDRRKAAKKRRDTKEEKEKAMRQQLGFGLATQLIGYSHTQAQLKNGMEAFLGLKKCKEEEQRLSKKLEDIARQVEKEPWDDDEDTEDDDEDTNAVVLDIPTVNTSFGERYVDDDLDDDTLLEAQNLAMSNPIEEPSRSPPHPPRPSSTTPAKLDPSFTRLHGPTNKAIERVLEQIPEPLIELLSQDISLNLPDWDPASSLLHKLNRPDLPPHRLRIKVGSIVSLLRDLNTSSPVSRSQHLRILRAENDRLECLVLDGQLQGTKAILTRVAFSAKYRDDHLCPFQRTQFPIRISIEYEPRKDSPDTLLSKLKEPAVLPGQAETLSIPKRTSSPIQKVKPQTKIESKFRAPGTPASRSAICYVPRPFLPYKPEAVATPLTTDGWDDFLDSSTQIAREIYSEASINSALPLPTTTTSVSNAHNLPQHSAPNLAIPIDGLKENLAPECINPEVVKKKTAAMSIKALPPAPAVITKSLTATQGLGSSVFPLPSSRRPATEKTSSFRPKPRVQSHQPNGIDTSNIATLTPSQRPPSVSDRPGLKRQASTVSMKSQIPSTKRPCTQQSRLDIGCIPLAGPDHFSTFDDFDISSQEVAYFFADDDELSLGSPPVTV